MAPVKFAVALALSLGGTVFTFLRSRRPSLSSSGVVREVDLRGEGDEEDLKLGEGSSSSVQDPEEHQRVIKSLQNTVKFLEERERELEVQLFEYYGLKEDLEEHQRGIRSLRNRVKFLEERERELEVQLLEYYGLKEDLEEHQRGIRSLRNRVKFLEERERELEVQLREYYGLQEDEVAANERLQKENADLALKLEKLQNIATSALQDGEIEALRRESRQLRQQNEGLSKEIEQLQADGYTDGAELRNDLPSPGETSARHLSKTLSPESEKKAKQLLLEYPEKEGSGEKVMMTIQDFDAEDAAKTELVKLAEALNISSSHGKPAVRMRSAAFGSF